MAENKVAVVGAGTIGASWVALFLARGFEVVVSDPAPGTEAFVRGTVNQAWPALTQLGHVLPDASQAKLSFEADPAAAVVGASFVQENGPEREELKIQLTAFIDAALPPDVVIASSSSGLLMSRIQSQCRHPERCVIGHPFNPPHLIPLVEVVGGGQTSPATIQRAAAFYRRLGKRPIILNKEIRGHIANRLQAALWREAIHLVAEGVASVADVDAAVTHGPGLRWSVLGPHMAFHLGGGEGGMEHFLRHLLNPVQSWWDDLGFPTMTPALQAAIIAGVQTEAGGRLVAELAEDRDRRLIAVLHALAGPFDKT